MTWTIPNILTVGRLIAVPLLPVMFLFFYRPYADWFALVVFIVASVTDYVDGYLARAWSQESRFGAAMDPIADKALVLTALLVIAAYSGLAVWIILPSAIIIFREVFVSGLREFLGDQARALKVTKIGKWKTTVQMVALTFLFAKGVFEHYVGMQATGMAPEVFDSVIAGERTDHLGLGWKMQVMVWSGNIGVVLLWVAALLTAVSGYDYFRKAWPYLKEKPDV
ncbi:CDP-diacylglycerol--glycerol-3-phosphate 3-phosphatidyltransferase [Maritimibacter sp. DP1N21-5]|uniref:CDP-diacylglycerol--glycerol-3-phosphate 3-phosphatidyltransferase n=1 Tax=Maritimibacter sp. DP1N21-5 TaxID=2836867 RepID=UPI001C497C1E|nr:CDP-diacylglycerol--glycerol-3-phosphate 3-phosphatidyltransferase [Maritimibacter sp. DP1N21-5]MBV7407607.1 CDP-diacylglycerol--glycerol-3-phosphate 3-phosphatidyltransferase [Maritimibacter sp. DP1N21-5]